MINVARIVPSDVPLVATVHDELIYDVPADRAEELCGIIRMAMEDAWYQLFGKEVPIVIDAKVCDNWAEK
jgi:DNA polymerase I